MGEWLDKDPARCRSRPELSWRSSIESFGARGRSLPPAILDYQFTLPLGQLNRGLVYEGGAARLRRAVHKLLTRRKGRFKVAALGGSISWGQGASVRGETDWFSLFSRWLITTFPRANITARNGCTPGVPTPYMIMCLELSVDPDVDLVFIEYTLNDLHALRSLQEESDMFNNRIVKDTERLIRRVLALPNHPAVVLMHSMPVGMANYARGHPKNPTGSPYRYFFLSSEDIQSALAQYYDIQYLSLRTAVYRLAAKETPGFMWEQLFVDHHPGDHGHKVMADLAVHLVQRAALGLLMEPYDSQDREVVGEPLPPPMYPGNLPPSSPMCRVGEAFRSLVVLSEGFEYLNEGSAVKPKPGFVATQPGARLRLRLDTDRSAVGCAVDEKVHIYLHHLRSYEHMGSAKLSCVSGCACAEVAVDAHITDRVSQVYMAELVASQARECVVQVQVLPESSSGAYKFKVSGVVVAELAGAVNAASRIGAAHDQPFGLRQHTYEAVQVTWDTQRGRSGGSADDA